MRDLKLSEVANKLGITKRTLYNWKKENKINFIKKNKLNYISYSDYCDLAHIKHQNEEKIVIYARVSSSENKSNLDSQAERLISYCMAKGYKIHKIIKEVGSGINDNRQRLIDLLVKDDFTKIIVEHKDRLTRIGFNYIKVLLENKNKYIEIVNEVDNKEDLIQDFVSIITSYCAKIYGKRRSTRRTEQLIKKLEEDNN